MVGLLTIDNGVIKTNLARDAMKRNMHFVVLRYDGDIEQSRKTFKRICYRFQLGETWFIRGVSSDDSYVMSLSFAIFPWSKYRKILFDKGIDRSFRDSCFVEKCGHIYIDEIDRLIFKAKPKRSRTDMTLQQSLSSLLGL